MPENDPIRPTDDEARALARRLLDEARFGALAVIDPETGGPTVTRVATATSPAGAPLLLVSELSQHTRALRANPACSLLVGEPGPKGEPLAWPRLTVNGRARFVEGEDPGRSALRDRFLAHQPKSALYIDFADFHFVVIEPDAAFLNGGFGRAFRLLPLDLLGPA